MKQTKSDKNQKNSWFSLCFSQKSLRQIYQAGIYSLSGFKFLLKERAFVQELILFIVAIPFAFYLAQSAIELILLIVSVALILLIEAINTAIEKTIDRIGDEIHPLSKTAKDIGSFCVFFSFAIAIFIWLAIFLN